MPIDGIVQAKKVSRDFVTKVVPSKIKATAEGVAMYALEKAVELSPIMSGRFAASWRITTPNSGAGPAGRGHWDRAGAMAEAEGASLPAISRIMYGSKFTLENATPYAQFIEYGSPHTEAHYITRRVAQAIGGKFGKI